MTRIGTAYEARIEITQNVTPVAAFSIDNGSLPSGVSIERIPGENAAGHIFGTPTAAGTSTFTVYAWCYGTNVSGQTGTREYTITVR